MKHEHGALRRILLLALPVSALSSFPGPAQAEDSPELPPVTVSADKVERPLEKVPTSVAVIGGLEVEQSGITRMEQLEGRVPGLSFQPFGQAGMNFPVMRGLTANFNSFSTSTLLLVDGVPTLTAQGFEHGMLDIDRIEVLRGPQSTLYGRNAEAGVISIHSLPMDGEPRASMAVEAGSRDRRALQFALSRPIAEERLYASIAGSWMEQGGFIDNTYTGRKEDGRERGDLRFGLRWTPSAATDLALRYARSQYDDGAALWGAPAARRAQVASGTASWNRSRGQTLSLKARHELASGLKLHSVTALNDFRDRVQQDTDFMPADMLHIGRNNHLRTLSQELRLEGRAGAADWLAGLYADRSDNALQSISLAAMGLADVRGTQKSGTAAIFVHGSLPLSERWTLSAGARIERMEVEFLPLGAVRRKQAWTSLSPKLALQYQIGPQHQWYASISRGVRTGGFNVMSPAMNYPAYGPEKAWSYESGIKGALMGRRLRYSLAAYAMDIGDMQVMQMPVPGTMYITSAASASSKGLELDLDYLPGKGWQIQGGLAWNRTRFDRFVDGAADYGGRHNPFAPDLSGHIGVRYQAAQGWYAQASLRGSGKVYLDAANRYRRNGYGLLDLAAGYRHGHWELSAYVHNAANRRYDAVGYQNGFVTVYSPPREAGVWLAWRM